MQAELLKMRSMPTPLWCGAAVLVGFLTGLVVTFIWGAGRDLDSIALIAFPTAIASIVIGVWIFGVEYGQNTMRRTLTADPDRRRLVLAKLATVLLVVAAVTVALYLLALPLYGLANSGHDFAFGSGDLLREAAAAVFDNLAYVLVGAAFAMITSSMAGGMTAALVFIFVLDGMLSLVPKVGDFTFGLAMGYVGRWISGSAGEDLAAGAGHSTPVAALIVIGWLAVLLALGVNRLLSSDVK